MKTMKVFTSRLLFALLLLAGGLSSCTENKPDVFGSIHGYVADETTGEPIQTASVTINPGGNKVVTGSGGRFEYTNLEAGQYNLQVMKEGYQSNVGYVKVIPGETANCDILLRPGDSYLKVNKSEINMGFNNNIAAFEISNTGRIDLQWTIKKDCDWITDIDPLTGTTAAGKKSTVTIQIDRNKLEAGKTSSYSIVITSNAGAADVRILASGKGATDNPEEPENPETPAPGGDVTAGLLAYYTFDKEDAKDATDNKINGTLINTPEFISDTPNNQGKGLFLNGTLEQYVNIPYNPLKNKDTYSISFWLKDFGSSLIFSAVSSSNITDHYPALLSRSDGKFEFVTGYYDHYDHVPFSYLYKSIQNSKWHMITLVATPNNDTYTKSDCIKYLYVDGELIDSAVGNYGSNQTQASATKIQLGGNGDGKYQTYGSMKLDNIRFYDRALEASEVESIYKFEQTK